MELVVKVSSKDLKKYDNASIFLFGLENFSSVEPFTVTIDELRKLKSEYKDKKFFLAIDRNLFNRDLDALEEILLEIDKLSIEGIMFYDLAVLNMALRLKIKTPLIWNQDFLVTNYETCRYYLEEGVKGAVLSSVLTISEVLEIAKNVSMDLFVPVFGYQSMAFSKRKLISNYYDNFNLDNKKLSSHILERGRRYSIKESKFGTKLLSDEVLNGIMEVGKLKESNVKYLILSSEGISDTAFKEVLDCYLLALKDYSLEELNQRIVSLIPNSSSIFFNRKTIYKVKK